MRFPRPPFLSTRSTKLLSQLQCVLNLCQHSSTRAVLAPLQQLASSVPPVLLSLVLSGGDSEDRVAVLEAEVRAGGLGPGGVVGVGDVGVARDEG